MNFYKTSNNLYIIMTYEINTPWKKLHNNEIEELNQISNQEFRIEEEICRKLRIIRKAKEAVNKAINDFNFDVVIRFMTQVGWKWAYTTRGNAVPTKEDFINFFYGSDCLKHALYDMIELGKNSYDITTGGVIFKLICTDLDYADETNTFCSIAFDISQWRDEFAEF